MIFSLLLSCLWPFLPPVVVHCYYIGGQDVCMVENRNGKPHTLTYSGRSEPIPFAGRLPWSFTTFTINKYVYIDGKPFRIRRI